MSRFACDDHLETFLYPRMKNNHTLRTVLDRHPAKSWGEVEDYVCYVLILY